MSQKETFLINVHILEGRHYCWSNMDSAVITKVNKKYQTSSVKYNTDNPYYNEYFVFELTSCLEDLMNKTITITVFQPRACCRRRAVLGAIIMDIDTLWSQEDHQFYHKWAVLSAPLEEYSGGSRGFLKVSISMANKNVGTVLPTYTPTDDIFSNLLLPNLGMNERARATFEFSVYRAEHIYPRNKEIKTNNSVYVEICFANQKVKTHLERANDSPIWNETLTLVEYYPPLCRRIHINIYFHSCLKTTLHCSEFINLKTISNDSENGFLPSFGPAYIHFYKLKDLEGYSGRLLIALHTKLNVNLEIQTSQTNLPDIPYSFQNFSLFASIFNAGVIRKNLIGKNIQFKMSFGSDTHDSGAGQGRFNLSDMYNVKKLGKFYKFVPLCGEKPLLSILTAIPDYRHKLYNLNMLEKISKELGAKIELIKAQFEDNEIKNVAELRKILTKTLVFLNEVISKYIRLASSYKLISGDTELNSNRLNFRLSEMENILLQIEEFKTTVQSLTTTCEQLIKINQRILELTFHAPDVWPDIFVWLIAKGKNVAYVRIPSHEVLYSTTAEENGMKCGKLTTIYFTTQKSKAKSYSTTFSEMVCQAQVFMWLGPTKSENTFYKLMPKGFEPDSLTTIPRLLNCSLSYPFQLRAHLFEGRCRVGFDKSALCDPYVRIIIGNSFKTTQYMKQTLNPIWDQTLVIKPLYLYGTRAFIRKNPPRILMEVYDYDCCCDSDDEIGKNEIIPLVKTKDEPYAPPLFPPKLAWISTMNKGVSSGEILAAFELLEITTEKDIDSKDDDKFISIPDDIRPIVETYRIEILFWGMRDLKRIQLQRINKPRITLEYNNLSVVSDTIANAKILPNFTNNVKFLMVGIPRQIEYASPIVLKLHDCRNFGMHIYAGAYIEIISKYIYLPLTNVERDRGIKTATTSDYTFSSEDGTEKLVTQPKESAYTVSGSKSDKFSHSDTCLCKKLTWRKLLCRVHSSKCTCEHKLWSNGSQKSCSCIETVFQRKVNKLLSSECELCWCCNNILGCLKTIIIEHKIKCSCNSLIQQFWLLFGSKCECCKQLSERIKLVFADYSFKCWNCKIFSKTVKKNMDMDEAKTIDNINLAQKLEMEEFDWWTKFYTSHEPTSQNYQEVSYSTKIQLQIYKSELEMQPEFHGLTDMLCKYPIYKGKATGDELIDKQNVTAQFKGGIRIYPWPPKNNVEYVTPEGLPLQDGIFQSFPANEPIHYLLRVYIVQAINLRPNDRSGKADPYLYLNLNNQIIDDKENTKMQQLNPIFGSCFEFTGVFPKDHTLSISIWDYDMTTRDDFIGETSIDLEQRFYTNHRAHCGLPINYYEEGPYKWRDQQKPCAILEGLCKKWKLNEPEYSPTSVNVASKEFEIPHYIPSGNPGFDRQVLALHALRNWHEIPLIGFHLVPEHVETRSLYNYQTSCVEQGKLQMWIDIFPSGTAPPPRVVNITPRKPVKYELRIIIWNAVDVQLVEDDFFFGEKKSDIYIAASLLGHDNDQYTDVHYRSISGEGNFNWRFVFPLEYISTENKQIIYRKDTMFSVTETEVKLPCKLTFVVWDNDTFSPDEFIGTLTLDLCHMPRGSKNPDHCQLEMVDPESAIPKINLFKVNEIKGWWPVQYQPKNAGSKLTGKLELQFQLLPEEEALKDPVGLGRNGPKALPEPNRPDTAFNVLWSPLKALKYFIITRRRVFFKCFFVIFLIIFILVGIYSIPSNFVSSLFRGLVG